MANFACAILVALSLLSAQLGASEHTIDHASHDQTEQCWLFKPFEGGKTLLVTHSSIALIQTKSAFLISADQSVDHKPAYAYSSRAPPYHITAI